MANTLTRSRLLEATKLKFEWVQIEPLGRVGIRAVSQLQVSRRQASYRDAKTGDLLPSEIAKLSTHKIIDQLMENETTPMFTEADFTTVADMDIATVGPILDAIDEFNEEHEKNGSAG